VENTEKRPETWDDLPGHQKLRVVVADIRWPEAYNAEALAAMASVTGHLQGLWRGTKLQVHLADGSLIVRREQDDDEKAHRLASAQEDWDAEQNVDAATLSAIPEG
jgi:hypothetical protein